MDWNTITPVITFILGFLGKFGFDLWHDRHIDKKRRQENALKKHFHILENRFISPMLVLLNNKMVFYGEISNKGQGRGRSPEDKPFTIDFKEGDGNIFKLHFQNKVEEIEKLMEATDKHKIEFDKFLNGLKEKIHKYTKIPFGNGKDRPFLYPHLTECLRFTLFQSIEGGTPFHDFKNAQISCENHGEYWSLISDGAYYTAYADLTSEKECQDCKQKLIELQYSSPKLMEKVRHIDSKAKQIRREIEKIVESLDFLCLKHKELEQLLNPQKECRYCQAIFHPNKGVKS